MKEFILLFSEANGRHSLAILNAESVEQAIQAVVRLAAFDRRALQVWDRETLNLIHVTSESATRSDAFSVLERNSRPFAEADRFGVTFIDPIAV
jgi:hypothetical protein